MSDDIVIMFSGQTIGHPNGTRQTCNDLDADPQVWTVTYPDGTTETVLRHLDQTAEEV